METGQTNQNDNNLLKLLGDSTEFKSELESGDEDMENPDGKSVEKYFNIKMINILGPEKSYTNVKICLSDFLEELKLYIFGKTFSNDGLNKKTAKHIMAQMNEYFKDETEIELDGFYTDVTGEKLQKFFQLINNCSFPKIVEIEQNINYCVIVESTYCLQKNVIKKSEQMRKIFLFFSILNKFYKQYKEYLEDFYEFFFKKHIFSEKKLGIVYDYKKSSNFDLSCFDNFVLLFVSNSKIDLFKEVLVDIEKTKPLQNDELKFGLKKCFNFPLSIEKTMKNIEAKKFSGEKIEAEPIMNKSADIKLFNSYKEFKYLISNINNETNFKVKLVYLDLYLNVFTPKKEIANQIDTLINTVKNITKKISENEQEFSEYKSTTDQKFSNTINNFNMKIQALVNFIQKDHPNFTFENLEPPH